jgi:Na+-transporting methylmalonyl-CoA/oxaloacetate decarboxylase gamma subunit
LILSAISCGLALGTKYNGLVVLLILTLLIPFVYINKSKTKLNPQDTAISGPIVRIQLKALGFGVIFVFIALLVFSPWMIRNYIWTSNPIYPLYHQIFNRDQAVPAESQAERQLPEPDADIQLQSRAKSTPWGSLAMRRVVYGESWWEIALIPVRIFFQGQDGNPKHFDGKLSPFLFLLPFFAFFQVNGKAGAVNTEKKIFIFFALLFVLYTFCTTSIRIRYIAPIIPPLVILSIFGFHNMVSAMANRWKTRPPWFTKTLILFTGGTVLSVNAIYMVQQFNYVQPITYLSGKMSRDAYIAKYRPEYSIYQYANLNLPENAKIMGLFLGNRRYYSDRELIFGQKEFQETIRRSKTPDMLIKELRQKGYTHIMVRFDLFNWWTDKQFDEGKKEMLKTFFTVDLEPILSESGYGLFKFRKI